MTDNPYRVYKLLTAYYLTYRVWQSPLWIAARLNLPVDMVHICIDDLITRGYVKLRNGKLEIWSQPLPYEYAKGIK